MSYLKTILSFLKNANPFKTILNGVVAIIVLSWLGLGFLFIQHPAEIIDFASHVNKIDVSGLSKISKRIDDQLDELMMATNSDRVSLSKFHDGKRSIEGLHFLFSSRTNEVRTLAASSALLITQDIPLAFLSDITEKLLQNHCAVINVRDGLSAARDWYRAQGIVTGFVACPIFVQGSLSGFIEVDAVSGSFEATGDSLDLIKATASRVEGILAQ